MKIYHNPRCRKSRETLSIILEKGINIEIIEYLKTPLKFEELKLILIKLDISPIDLVRKTEKVWKEKGKNKDLNNDEIIQLMTENPKIIERPIVENKKKAIIGRPPTNVLQIINQEGI